MSQKKLSLWIKLLTFGFAVCGAALAGLIVPRWLAQVFAEQQGSAAAVWTGFLWALIVPCYIALVFLWKIAEEIGRDNSFSAATSRALAIIARLAGFDAAALLLGALLLSLLGMSAPRLLLASAFISFVGLAISVISACLSHFAYKAAKLQEENDLTI